MPVKPSESEEEHFARLEFEKRKRALEETQARMAAEERKRIAEISHMRCPKCGAGLVALQYRGVEVDKCSACQGLWLDAGELERVVSEESSFVGGLKRMFGGGA